MSLEDAGAIGAWQREHQSWMRVRTSTEPEMQVSGKQKSL